MECLYVIIIISAISHVCLQPACTTAHSDAKIECCTKLYQFNFSERPRGPNRRHKLPVGNTPLSLFSDILDGIKKFLLVVILLINLYLYFIGNTSLVLIAEFLNWYFRKVLKLERKCWNSF